LSAIGWTITKAAQGYPPLPLPKQQKGALDTSTTSKIPATKWKIKGKRIYTFFALKASIFGHMFSCHSLSAPVAGCTSNLEQFTLAAERQVRDFLIGPRNKKQRKKRSTIKIFVWEGVWIQTWNAKIERDRTSF
jgi:hypothetical protein